MDWNALQTWLNDVPLGALALVLAIAQLAAGLLGAVLHRTLRKPKAEGKDDSQEGLVVSSVLGLLALLTGFTFALAVDRYDARRLLVLDDAKAIAAVYLRAQLLEEPHRERMTTLLVRYTDNRVSLGKARRGDPGAPGLLATNDQLVTDIWTATRASFDSIKGLDFSSAYLDSVNDLIGLDEARKAARQARVPVAVFTVLFVYLVATAGVLAYVLTGLRGRLQAAFLLALFTLSLLLIVDIDRPAMGAIVEGQGPMEDLQKRLKTWRPEVFDRWSEPAAAGGPSAGSPASAPPDRPGRPTP